jgi:hypothetical protein
VVAAVTRRLAWVLTLLVAALPAGCVQPALPFAAPGARTAARLGHAGSSLAYGTYEWNVDDAVTRWRSGTLWTLLNVKHVDDVLAGFDDAQIARYSTRTGSAEVNAMIAQGSKRGVRFELLLGDPSWMAPSGERALERILHELRTVRFAGLNLDLEPNEVAHKPIRSVLEDLVAVMRRYVAVSPWPVTLDVNYIYLDGRVSTGGYCLMCGLQTTGLRRVDLMTYVSNPALVFRLDAPLLRRYPWATFTIAQSVEPPSVLPPGDSYWSDGFRTFYADMRVLDARFSAAKNYGGIAVESMQYLEVMKR